MWQRAHTLALHVYRQTERLPPAERFGLSSQMRRAASSITANIAEGCGRNGDRELARYVRIALGSANELQCHLLLAADLSYLAREHADDTIGLVLEVKRMLASLERTARSRTRLSADS